MSLRIGVDARERVRGRQTGTGRYLEEIINRAIEVRPVWRWVCLLSPDGEERISAGSVQYRRLPGWPTPFVDQVVLASAIKRETFDLFHCPYLKGPWWSPCPVVVIIHDLIELRLPPEQGGRIRATPIF